MRNEAFALPTWQYRSTRTYISIGPCKYHVSHCPLSTNCSKFNIYCWLDPPPPPKWLVAIILKNCYPFMLRLVVRGLSTRMALDTTHAVQSRPEWLVHTSTSCPSDPICFLPSISASFLCIRWTSSQLHWELAALLMPILCTHRRDYKLLRMSALKRHADRLQRGTHTIYMRRKETAHLAVLDTAERIILRWVQRQGGTAQTTLTGTFFSSCTTSSLLIRHWVSQFVILVTLLQEIIGNGCCLEHVK
jgi:hypothetical protein